MRIKARLNKLKRLVKTQPIHNRGGNDDAEFQLNLAALTPVELDDVIEHLSWIEALDPDRETVEGGVRYSAIQEISAASVKRSGDPNFDPAWIQALPQPSQLYDYGQVRWGMVDGALTLLSPEKSRERGLKVCPWGTDEECIKMTF